MTNQEAIQGIDVSRHQGDVDFKTVWKRGGMSFAYVKATEGRDYLDPWFIRNWNKLLELDGDFGRGAYMFSRPDSIGGAADGKAEADDFCEALKSVGGYVDGAGPPVIDYEKYSGKGTAANLAYLDSAIKTIEDRLGRSPMIYTGRNVWNYQTDNSDRWAHLPLWLVEYTSKPEYGDTRPRPASHRSDPTQNAATDKRGKRQPRGRARTARQVNGSESTCASSRPA